VPGGIRPTLIVNLTNSSKPPNNQIGCIQVCG
jgi:hypothetical protein